MPTSMFSARSMSAALKSVLGDFAGMACMVPALSREGYRRALALAELPTPAGAASAPQTAHLLVRVVHQQAQGGRHHGLQRGAVAHAQIGRVGLFEQGAVFEFDGLRAQVAHHGAVIGDAQAQHGARDDVDGVVEQLAQQGALWAAGLGVTPRPVERGEGLHVRRHVDIAHQAGLGRSAERVGAGAQGGGGVAGLGGGGGFGHRVTP